MVKWVGLGHNTYPDLPGLLHELNNWIKSWEERLDNYNNLNNNKELK